jgi:hypothetical protein
MEIRKIVLNEIARRDVTEQQHNGVQNQGEFDLFLVLFSCLFVLILYFWRVSFLFFSFCSHLGKVLTEKLSTLEHDGGNVERNRESHHEN